MGSLSSLGKGLGGVIFYFSLNILILSMIMTQFLKYESIQPAVSSLLEKQIMANVTEDQLNLLHKGLIDECKKSTTGLVSFPISESKSTTFNCSEVNQSKSSDIPKIITKSFFDDIYYKKYDCNFIQCFSKGLGDTNGLLLFSFKAYNFFDSLVVYSAIGLAVSLFLLAISIRTWYGLAKTVGLNCIIVGIPLFIFFYFRESIIQKLIGAQRQEAVQLVIKVFESVTHILLIVFIAGIVLTIVGIAGNYLKKKHVKKEAKK
jgi:hypothetical protein